MGDAGPRVGEYFLISEQGPVGPFSALESIRPCDIDDQLGEFEVRVRQDGKYLDPPDIDLPHAGRAAGDDRWIIRVYTWAESDSAVLSEAAIADCLERGIHHDPIAMLVERGVDADTIHGDLHWVTYECDIGGAVSLRQAFDEARAVHERLLADVDRVRRATATTLEAVRDRIYGVDRLEISELLSHVGTAESPNSKGKALEDLVLRLLRSMPGFSAEVRRRNSTEEIDVEVVNDSDATFWKRSGDIILVECKNWAKPCGKDALSGLRDKMRHRRGRCNVGILISWSGFARTVRRHDARESIGDQVMLLLDRSDLEEAVSTGIEPVLRRAFLAATRE